MCAELCVRCCKLCSAYLLELRAEPIEPLVHYVNAELGIRTSRHAELSRVRTGAEILAGRLGRQRGLSSIDGYFHKLRLRQ